MTTLGERVHAVFALIKRLYILIFGVRPTECKQVNSTVLELPPKPKEKKGRAIPDDESGEFYFRETILDQLGYYMKCLERVRKVDPEAFALYSQVGGNVITEGALSWFAKVGAFKGKTPELPMSAELSPWFRRTLPSFGAVFIGKIARDVETKEDSWVPRFFYFRKYEPRAAPPEIQRVGIGAVYIATVYWDDPEQRSWGKGRKSGVPQDFPIVINPDGSVRLLRSLLHDSREIRHTTGKSRGKKFVIPRRQWVAADPWMVQWAHEYGAQVGDYLVALFVQVANMYETANSSVIRVTATNGELAASFGVDLKRTPYFFKDRETTLTESGKKKRIFHIVRAHVRKDGAAVKFHFRGEKSFSWNGYAIGITVPGRDHYNLAEFSVGAIDEDKMKPGVKGLGMKELGASWKRHVTRGRPLFERENASP